MYCFFATDLHGHQSKYLSLFDQIRREKPDVVFLGGDLLPMSLFTKSNVNIDVLNQVIASGLQNLKDELGSNYPRVILILGNEDPMCEERAILQIEKTGLWQYAHQRTVRLNQFNVIGYSYVPPTPFLNKDWERYDVSHYVDVGCVSPEEGYRSTNVSMIDIQNCTIWDDLIYLAGENDLSNTIMLFHSPPYNTGLDRAALDGKMVDYAPLDVHVGSIAIRRFIEQYQPLVSLHGHIHESFSLTGIWKEKIGKTICMSAAGNGNQLTLIKFHADDPDAAERIEIKT